MLVSTPLSCCNCGYNYSCPLTLPNCNCFCLPRVQFGAIIPSKPFANYILNDNGKPSLVPDYVEEKLEEVKSEESELVNEEG